MPSQPSTPDAANQRLARTLCCAVDGAGKPRHQIAREAGLHKDTLLRVIRGERPINLDEATRILEACGAPARATLALVLAGHEALAAQWMHHEMGAFLEEFFCALPGELHEALGDRIGDLRPRWAIGTSRLVARMLSKHIDEFADRDLSLAIGR